MYMYIPVHLYFLFNDTKGGYEEGNQLALFNSALMKRTQNLVDKTSVFQCIQNRWLHSEGLCENFCFGGIWSDPHSTVNSSIKIWMQIS